jgi:hypothetical protein
VSDYVVHEVDGEFVLPIAGFVCVGPLPPDLAEAFGSFGLCRPAEAFELRRTTGSTKSIELRGATDE